MKSILLLLCLACFSVVSAKTYYVATDGNNGNPGTIAAPWLTWYYGFSQLAAGDTLYIRGGTYMLSVPLNLTASVGGQGTVSDPIIVINYPDETPILDCDDLDASSGFGIERKSYWKFIGLHVIHVYQDGQPVKVNAIGVAYCNQVHLINCSAHDNGGSGFVFNANDTIYVRNCDSYNNCDSLGQPGGALGGKADGFQMFDYLSGQADTASWSMYYFYRCRAWNNSDDGWDFLRNTKAVVDSCWAIFNGYPLDGSGQGMKAGLPVYDPPVNQYVFTNNVSVYNKSGGFRDNCNNQLFHIASKWYNNTAAFNFGPGFSSSTHPSTANWNINILRNNLFHGNTTPYAIEDISKFTHDHNSFDIPIAVSDLDFLSVDSTGITGARGPEGELPDIDFLKLAPGSGLIDVGIVINGLPFNGTAPDLGCYESASVISTPEIPNYINSVIENATPSRLEITYNLTLANIVPAASFFAVRVNSVARTVSSVLISGTKVLLTLSSPVVYGDVVTIAYTKPATNPLQTSSGGQAESFTSHQVANNCLAPDVNQSPTVSLSSPTKSTSFIAPATITIDAVASDPDGTIIMVEFFQGSLKLGERTTNPYSYTWKEVKEGTYSITAVATDNKNSKTTSAAVSVVVEKSTAVVNQLPVIYITSSSDKNKYTKKDKIVIEAVASDPDGYITKVEIKNGNITLAEMTTAPYIYTWEVNDTGTFLITAIATDNLGARSTSSSFEVFVDLIYDANNLIINLYPNPNDGHFTIDLNSGLSNPSNKITIFSLTGKTVYEDIITELECSREINLSHMPAGSYVLMVSSSNRILSTNKYIKK